MDCKRFTQILFWVFVFFVGIPATRAQEITNGLISRYTFTNGSLNDTQGNNPLINVNGALANDRCGNANSAYFFGNVPQVNNPILPVTPRYLIANGSVTAGNPAGNPQPAGNVALATSLSNPEYTYCAWVNVSVLPTVGQRAAIMAVGNTNTNGTQGDQVMFISQNTNGALITFTTADYVTNNGNLIVNSADARLDSANATAIVNRWYFVCVTRSTTQLTIYANGRQLQQVAAVGTPQYAGNNTVLTIGARHNLPYAVSSEEIRPAPIQGFNGRIDDVRIYNRALSHCEIAQLYRQNPLTQTQPIAPYTITGPNKVCPNSLVTYSIERQFNPCTFDVQPQATSLVWSVPPGASVQDQTSNTVTILMGEQGGNVSVEERFPHATGCRLQGNLPITVTAITSSKLNVPVCGAYNASLTQDIFNPADGSLVWSASGLPSWLSLDANTGVITKTGTPSALGNVIFSVVVKQGTKTSCPHNVKVVVVCDDISINPLAMSFGTIGMPFGPTQLTIAGATCPNGLWSVSSGALPAGISLSTTGVLSGTPTQAGTFNFTVSYANTLCSTSKALSITVCPNVVLSTNSFYWYCGVPFTADITQSGVDPNITPISWSISSGVLPAGWTSSVVGNVFRISGTSTNMIPATFTVRLTLVNGCIYEKTYTATPQLVTPSRTFKSVFKMLPTNTAFIAPKGATHMIFESQSPDLYFNGQGYQVPVTVPVTYYNATSDAAFVTVTGMTLGEHLFTMKAVSVCGTSNAINSYMTVWCQYFNECPDGESLRPNMGGQDIKNTHSFEVVPNPAKEKITLLGNADYKYEISLQDAQGKLIATFVGNLKDVETQMNGYMGKLKSGVHFLRFKSEGGKIEVKKFIKTN